MQLCRWAVTVTWVEDFHHQQGLHHYNYSDIPVWDMLFGTYKNPAVVDNKAGFPDNNENKVWALLKGQLLKS